MSKSDIPLSRLDYRRALSKPSKPAWIDGRPINGYDTETADGHPFVLSYYFERTGANESLHNNGNPLNALTLFDAITHRQARAAINVWYNLDFDANVILARLPAETVHRLTLLNRAEWNGYDITYIKGKVLTIRYNKNRYDHYDVSQFFFTSLDNAAEEWLGRNKETKGTDVTKFKDLEYRREKLQEILHYARVDAELTAKVFRAFADEAERLEVPCGRPYSTGYLGEQAMNVQFHKHTNAKPGFDSTQRQSMSWDAYMGGRFEIIQRGDIGRVVTVDINSAYPHQLRRLPDPASLRWRRSRKPSVEEIEDSDFALIDVSLTTTDRIVQPFAVKLEGKLQFPRLHGHRLTLIRDQFVSMLDLGFIESFQLHKLWTAKIDDRTHFPFTFLEDLYERRQELKAQGRDKAQHVLKIIINSVYGKLCQVVEKKQLSDGNNRSAQFFPIDALPADIREWLYGQGYEIIRKYQCGSYFNPFLAAHITGRTRLALVESAARCNLTDSIRMLATDAVMFEESAFDASDFLDRYGGGGLGEWGLESRGSAFVVGSGVYEIEQDDGTRKSKSRGFERGTLFALHLGEESLKEAAGRAVGETLEISTHRPLLMSQALWQNVELSQVGRFMDFKRAVRAGMDSKRVWPRGSRVTWSDLLAGAEVSRPKVLA